MFVNIFEYRMRQDADLGYQELGAQMYQRVTSDPRFTFIEMKGFPTGPTEGVVIERFATVEGARLWASDPEHIRIKRRGQREFYAWYRGHGMHRRPRIRSPLADHPVARTCRRWCARRCDERSRQLCEEQRQETDGGQRCVRHWSQVANPAGGSSMGSLPSSSPGVGMSMLAAHSVSSSSGIGQVVCGASAWR